MNTKNIRNALIVSAFALASFTVLPLIVSADNAIPSTSSISPSFVPLGSGPITLTVNGANFIPGSIIMFNGSNRGTTYISSSQLSATLPASDFTASGSYPITVSTSSPGGGTSNAQLLVVGNSNSNVTSLSPSSVAAGSGGFTLTINGNNFVSGSVVRFNGADRSTSYVSGNQLTVSIPASDVAVAGNYTVAVISPGGGTAGTATFTVTGSTTNNLVPILTNMSPVQVPVGNGNFTLTVYGANFVSGSTVSFNGLSRPTTYISPSQLTATIYASDVAIAQRQAVMVVNPAPGGGTSNALLFTVGSITTTPGLPNTGIGPEDDEEGINSSVDLGIGLTALGAVYLVLFGAAKKLFERKTTEKAV